MAAAPREPGLRQLPSADGSDRPRRRRTSTPSAAGGTAAKTAPPVDASGGLPDGSDVPGHGGLEAGAAEPARAVRRDVTEKLLTYALGRGLESYDAPAVRADRARRRRQRLSFLVARAGDRQEHAVSRSRRLGRMIITNMALPRRTFLRGVGATLALPLLDAMVPALSALAAHAGRAGAAPGFRLRPDGHRTGVAGRRRPKGRITELSPTLTSLTPFLDQVTVLESRAQERATPTGNHATANCTLPERRPREADRRQRL